MPSTADAAIFDVLVRMVVPMRREFGLTLDVQQARRDTTYARRMIERARSSQAERLRGYAEFVDSLLEDRARAAADTPAAEAEAAHALALRAARLLVDAVGPMGEPLAVHIESARDAAARQRLLDRAATLVAQVRGNTYAQDWRQRVQAA